LRLGAIVEMKLKLAVFVLLAVTGAPVLACSYPAAPGAIPDGKNVSKEAMLAKKKEIDKYKRDVEEFLACETNPLKLQSAQAELDRVANRFNAEVRAFKAANGS
jgi:hypothetical protein